jgi:DNA primase
VISLTLDTNSTKYLIKAKIVADGIVEKPDVVGAVFGQTEGLLGEDLDLRDLQKSGRIGRIEVEIESKKGKSEGNITIPSSLDQVETAILASALETVDRVGPCKAQICIDKIEDIRLSKRNKIVERAKVLLIALMEDAKQIGANLTESVKQAVQAEEITSYGKDKLPAGPNIDESDAIIIVEGRSDVLNLLKHGIKNVIGVEGTNISKTIQDLSKEKIVTVFVDGDRGGELILKELLQVAEVDYIAQASKGYEVEDLTEKQIIKCLRNKIPVNQFVDMYGYDIELPKEELPILEKQSKRVEESQKEEVSVKKLSPRQLKYKNMLTNITRTSRAVLLNSNDNVVMEVPVRELAETLKKSKNVSTIVFDGIVTQRLLDIAVNVGVSTIVGNKFGNVTKRPVSIDVYTRAELD